MKKTLTLADIAVRVSIPLWIVGIAILMHVFRVL